MVSTDLRFTSFCDCLSDIPKLSVPELVSDNSKSCCLSICVRILFASD